MSTPLQIDPGISAQSNMLKLINANSTLVFTGTEFTFGIPQDYVPADSSNACNTSLVLTPTQGSGFTGEKTIHYKREALGNTRLNAATTFTIGMADDINTVTAMVCSEHLIVGSEVVASGVLPTVGNSATFTLTAKTGSLLYTGALSVTINYPTPPTP